MTRVIRSSSLLLTPTTITTSNCRCNCTTGSSFYNNVVSTSTTTSTNKNNIRQHLQQSIQHYIIQKQQQNKGWNDCVKTFSNYNTSRSSSSLKIPVKEFRELPVLVPQSLSKTTTKISSMYNSNNSLYRTIQKRYFMDVHTRPSHSGMFPVSNPLSSSTSTSTSTSTTSTTTTMLNDSKNSSSNEQGSDNSNKENVNDNDTSSLFSVLYMYYIILYRALIAISIVHCTSEYIGDITLCEGPSMYPTIYTSGEVIYIDKLFYRLSSSSLSTTIQYISSWLLHLLSTANDNAASQISNNNTSWIASERIKHAYQQQKIYEKQQQQQQQRDEHKKQQIQKQSIQNDDSSISNCASNNTETDDTMGSTSTTTSNIVYNWYEPIISISDIVQYYKSHMSLYERCIVCFQHMISPLSVGDIVVVQHPNRRYGTVCKRIIGLPGDQIIIVQQQQQQQQQHTSNSNNNNNNNPIQQLLLVPVPVKNNRNRIHRQEIITVPDGFVWLEGDNPSNSSDSRNSYGCIPSSFIVGRALYRVWPIGPNIQYNNDNNETSTSKSSTSTTRSTDSNEKNKKNTYDGNTEESDATTTSSSNNNNSDNDNNIKNKNYHIHRTMAWFVRGRRPHESADGTSTSIVIPAGYNGQAVCTTICTPNDNDTKENDNNKK